MLQTRTRIFLASAIFAVMCQLTLAGTINLNDTFNSGDPFMSTNYMWMDVVETNGDAGDPAFNYYRDPLTFGDTFSVNPTNFRVEISPGPGLDQIDSQLEMIIMGKDTGNGVAVIPEIIVNEEGDFNVFGNGGSFVKAEMNWFWQVLEGPGAGMTASGTEVFQGDPNDSGTWALNMMSALPAGTTKVRFEFDNRLTGFAEDDLSLAFIAKKTIPGIKINVPEPASALILSSLCLALGFVRRQF